MGRRQCPGPGHTDLSGLQAAELRDVWGSGDREESFMQLGRRSGEASVLVKSQCQGTSWNTMVTDTKQR